MLQNFSPIQNHILSRLKNAQSLRYSQLQLDKVPNDLFNYHLQYLVKKEFIDKTDKGYSLSKKGIKHVADPYPTNDAITSLFKINVITLVSRVINGKTEILNQIRKSNPSYGKIGVPGGVVLKGELIESAARRKLKHRATARRWPIFYATMNLMKNKSILIISIIIIAIFVVVIFQVTRSQRMISVDQNSPVTTPTPTSTSTPPVKTIPPQTQSTGTLQGTMSIGPICPVERIGHPCTPTPEMYAAHQVYVYDTSRTKIITTLIPDAQGNFTGTLFVGSYFVDVQHQAIGGVQGVPSTVEIKARKTTTINISIDTGIR